jgi:hypothetical protein
VTRLAELAVDLADEALDRGFLVQVLGNVAAARHEDLDEHEPPVQVGTVDSQQEVLDAHRRLEAFRAGGESAGVDADRKRGRARRRDGRPSEVTLPRLVSLLRLWREVA